MTTRTAWPSANRGFIPTTVSITSDDWFVISGSDDFAVRVWDLRSGKAIGSPMEHNTVVGSVCISRDNQKIISMDCFSKVYLWSVSSGDLLECATAGPDCARLLCKGRDGWTDGEEVGVESDKDKSQIAVVGQYAYICDPMRNGNFFEKAGQFDGGVRDWGVDANGMLWVRIGPRNLVRLRVVPESFNTLQNFENGDFV